MIRLLAQGIHLSSNASGGAVSISIESGSGGAQCKQVMYMIAVRAKSGSNVRINAELFHDPNDRFSTSHSDVIGTDAAPVAVPADNLFVGQSDDTLMLGDFLALAVTCRDSAATSVQWVIVDIYEIRRNF